MELVTPSIGLIIWQVIIFGLLLFVLGRFAWGPILKIIEKREKDIKISLENNKDS